MLWISKALIHRVVDLLPDMTDQSPSATTAGGWQLLAPFLLQARSQFGFASAFGSIPLVTRTQVFMERAIVLASAGRDEIGDAHIDANHRCIRWRLHEMFCIVGEREPPHAVTLIELHAAVELPCLPRLGVGESFFVVRSEFDGHGNGLALLKRADGQPVIIG